MGNAREPAGGQSIEVEDFEALASRHASGLYRFALSLVRSREAAEDLVQETFIHALERRGQFRGTGTVQAWLRRILHNLAVDQARHLSREVPAEDGESKWRDDAYTVDSAVVVERAEDREELEDALVRLPFIYRAWVVLHDIEGWTMAEVTSAMGWNSRRRSNGCDAAGWLWSPPSLRVTSGDMPSRGFPCGAGTPG